MSTTWYVSPSGSDTAGSGTSTSPYATLSKAHGVAVDGDIIQFLNGAYTISNRTLTTGFTITKQITLRGRESISGTRPSITIETAVEGSAFAINASNVTIYGLEIIHRTFSSGTTESGTGGSNATCINLLPGGTGVYPDAGLMVNENISIDDCLVQYQKFGVSSKAKYFSVLNSEIRSRVTTATTQRAIAIYSQDGNILIDKNNFTVTLSTSVALQMIHQNFATNDSYINKRNGKTIISNNTMPTIGTSPTTQHVIFFEAGTDDGVTGDQYELEVINNTVTGPTSNGFVVIQPDNTEWLNTFLKKVTITGNTVTNLPRGYFNIASGLSSMTIPSTEKFVIHSNTYTGTNPDITANTVIKSPAVSLRSSGALTTWFNADSSRLTALESIITNTSGPAVTAPGAPTLLPLSATATQIELEWTAPTFDGGAAITAYKIYRDDILINTLSTSPLPLTYIDTTVVTDSTYNYSVSAINSGGESIRSNVESAKADGPPSAPANFTATRGDGEALLNWNAANPNGGTIQHYLVFYRVGTSGVYNTGINVGNVTSYTLGGLTNGVTYTVYVKAVDDTADGQDSDTKTVTPVKIWTALESTIDVTQPTATVNIGGVNMDLPIINNAGLSTTSNGDKIIMNLNETTLNAVAIVADLSTLGVAANTANSSSIPYVVVRRGVGDGAIVSIGHVGASGSTLTVSRTIGGSETQNVRIDLSTLSSNYLVIFSIEDMIDGVANIFFKVIDKSTNQIVPSGFSIPVEFDVPSAASKSSLILYRSTDNALTYETETIGTAFKKEGSEYTFNFTFTSNSDNQAVVAPNEPTGVSASANSRTSATVSFVAPTNNGGSPILSYTVTASSSNGGVTVTSSGNSSPILINGLTDGKSYTFGVAATNKAGTGPEGISSVLSLASVPCLTRGTRVLTSSGYKPVETLSTKDDKIVTPDGRAVTFKLYSTTIERTSTLTAPYLIKKNAYGPAKPARDIKISPQHAVQMSNGLWDMPKFSKNTSVNQVDIGETVQYFHVELPNYFTDNLVCEGLVAEAFAAKQVPRGTVVYRQNPTLDSFTRMTVSLITHKAHSKSK